MNLHEIELGWMRYLHEKFRSPLLDQFFLAWNYVDSFVFLLVLIAIIWHFCNKLSAIRLLYIFILSGIANSLLKNCFSLPRPCQMDPTLGIIYFSTPGLPSGAAQTAMLLAAIVFMESSKKSYRYLAVVFALFLCFSKIYLGLHYFSDILGGLAVGAVLLLIYYKVFPLIEPFWKRAIFIFPFALLLLNPSKMLFPFALSVGLAAGLFLDKQREIAAQSQDLPHGSKWRFLNDFVYNKPYLEFLSSTLGALLFLGGAILYPKLNLLFIFTGGFWYSFLGAWGVRKIKSSSHVLHI